MSVESSPPKRRRRRNDPIGLRSRILDRAARLFQERGFHAASMQDVMVASGVSAGALHHHFPTKKSLALAVLSERVRSAVEEAWIIPVRRAPALAQGVADVFADIVRGIQTRGTVYGCPLNNLALELSLSDIDLRKGMENIFVEWRTAIEEEIGRTHGGMRLGAERRAAAANFIIAAYSGAMNMAKATQSATPLVDAARLLAQWLQAQGLAS